MSKRVRASLAVLTLLVGFVASCGGDDDDSTVADKQTTTTTAATADDPNGVNAGVVDGYCSVKAELDAQDSIEDESRLQDLLDTTPPEIADEVQKYVDARKAGDFYASEALDAFADDSCTPSRDSAGDG